MRNASSQFADSNRLIELDSLRGLAALTVVFYHYRSLWESQHPTTLQAIGSWFLQAVSGGTEAVILFFVLSGFVLSIPAIRGKAQPYRVFLTRRIFRIYIPYLAALAIAILCDAKFHSYLPLSNWFLKTWSTPITWQLILQHVLLVGHYDYAQFNTAFWSIVIEMRVSLFFPLLSALVLRFKPSSTLFLAIFVSFLPNLLYQLPNLEALRMTLHYTGMFLIGIYLARQQAMLSRIYASLSRKQKLIAAFGFLLSYLYGRRLFMATGLHFGALPDLTTTLGAAGIIVWGLNSAPMRRVLLVRPVRLLGKISYSMYLIHGTILFSLVHIFYGRWTLWTIFPLYLATVIALSTVLYSIVEKPSMDLGRRLSNRLKAAPEIAAQPGSAPSQAEPE